MDLDLRRDEIAVDLLVERRRARILHLRVLTQEEHRSSVQRNPHEKTRQREGRRTSLNCGVIPRARFMSGMSMTMFWSTYFW